jgi:hypothetical protein
MSNSYYRSSPPVLRIIPPTPVKYPNGLSRSIPLPYPQVAQPSLHVELPHQRQYYPPTPSSPMTSHHNHQYLAPLRQGPPNTSSASLANDPPYSRASYLESLTDLQKTLHDELYSKSSEPPLYPVAHLRGLLTLVAHLIAVYPRKPTRQNLAGVGKECWDMLYEVINGFEEEDQQETQYPSSRHQELPSPRSPSRYATPQSPTRAYPEAQYSRAPERHHSRHSWIPTPYIPARLSYRPF